MYFVASAIRVKLFPRTKATKRFAPPSPKEENLSPPSRRAAARSLIWRGRREELRTTRARRLFNRIHAHTRTHYLPEPLETKTYTSTRRADQTSAFLVPQGMSNVTRTTQVPLGESLLGDVSNLDQFLGVSSSTYHFTRLSCRKTMDGVVGAGEGIKRRCRRRRERRISLNENTDRPKRRYYS